MGMANFSFVLAAFACLYLPCAHGQNGNAVDWKNANMTRKQIPAEVIQGVSGAKVQQKTVKIGGADIFYRESLPTNPLVEPTGQTLVLLHGAAFSSATWVNRINTIQTMSAAGHRVVAIDLPGFGRSERSSLGNREFLATLLESLAPATPVVIVSPSYSGTFSLPLLTGNPELFSGFIPVAPSATGSYRSRLSSVQVPTMIVVGQLDGFGSSRTLEQIPTSTQIQVIPKARHPAYLDDADLWHQLVYNFMELLQN